MTAAIDLDDILNSSPFARFLAIAAQADERGVLTTMY